MQAARSGRQGSKPHRSRLLHGPDWVSPYSVPRAALRRVTRSQPADFHPSRGVVVLGDGSADAPTADVVDLTARRQQRAAEASRSAAEHPSRWQPA